MVRITAYNSSKRCSLICAKLSLEGIDWEQEDEYTVLAKTSMSRATAVLNTIPLLGRPLHGI